MSSISRSIRCFPRLSILTMALVAAAIVAGGVFSAPPAQAGGPIVVDGFVQDPVTGVVESGYVVQGITYTQDQNDGDFAGLLFKAEGDTDFHFAFAQSVFINDNTYFNGSKNDTSNPEIGWGSLGRAHRIQDLLQSEHIEVQLFDSAVNLILDFFLD